MRGTIHKNFQAKKKYWEADFILLCAFGILTVFGLLTLASASSVVSYQKYESTYRILFHQIVVGIIPGLILFYFFYKKDYHTWEKFNFLFFILIVFLLSLVFIPGFGESFGRAQSWVSIFGITFQPSEVVKFLIILYFAGWAAKKGFSKVQSFHLGFIPFSLTLFIILAFIAKQPDIGTLMIVTFIAVVLFFIAGGRFSHMAIMGIAGFCVLSIIMIRSEHIRERFSTFLNPSTDPQNIGYHINQAYLAVGSGGFFGRGFGKSVQKFSYLPEVASDSIFAVIAEELGFFVSCLLIILLLVIIFRGLSVARDAPDPYGRLIASGVVAWFGFQAFLNIMVMIGLAPLTGIPFPFISAGGSSLAASLAAAGILLNISKFRESY